MSFDMDRLRRYQPDEELTQQEIKDLKDGVPNYPMPESEGPEYPHEWLCGECTGSGIMLGFYPCKPCGGKGYIVPESVLKVAEDILDQSKKEREEAILDMMLFGRASIDMKKQYEDYEKEIEPYKKSIKNSWDSIHKILANNHYPNERELSLLNNRIATLKAQLSKELQKKKSERSQRDINQLQQ